MSGAYEARMEAGREVMMGEAQTMFDDGFFDEEIKDLILSGEFDDVVEKRAKKLMSLYVKDIIDGANALESESFP